MVTAKSLDTLKGKIDSKKEELEAIKLELAELQTQFQSDAQEFLADAGVSMEEPKAASKKGKANSKAKAIITKMIGKHDKVEIKLPEKQKIASEAGCSIDDVNATLKADFIGYPIGKGRKGSFGMK